MPTTILEISSQVKQAIGWCVKSACLLRWGELRDIWWRFYTN